MAFHRGVLRAWPLLAVLAGVVGQPACAEAPASAEPDYGKTPVLFVHGSGLSAGSWNTMIAHLRQRGYPAEYLLAVEMTPNYGPNVRAAELFIAPGVETLLERANHAAAAAGEARAFAKVDIVAHSMGAGGARWYATRMKPERVRTWISVAGANHGTRALCRSPHDGDLEMCPPFATSAEQSALQVQLNGTPADPIDETPYGLGADTNGAPAVPPDKNRAIAYFALRLQRDRWIDPARSAELDGCGGVPVPFEPGPRIAETSPGNYLCTARIGHDEFITHPLAIELVYHLLAVRDG